MMLAHVETMEAQAVVKLGKCESFFVLFCQREAGAVVLIEDAKFHDEHPFEGCTVDARLDLAAGPDMQLKQIALGVSERCDATVRTHVAA